MEGFSEEKFIDLCGAEAICVFAQVEQDVPSGGKSIMGFVEVGLVQEFLAQGFLIVEKLLD